jgi:hypothetical protein
LSCDATGDAAIALLERDEQLRRLADAFHARGVAAASGYRPRQRRISDGGKPSLLVMEDVHWADTATLDLIRFLARRIARVRALILITYRDEEVDARTPMLIPRLWRRASAVQRKLKNSASTARRQTLIY